MSPTPTHTSTHSVTKQLNMPSVKNQAQRQIADGKIVLGLPKRLGELRTDETWKRERKANGRKFKDFADYCRTNQPCGLGLGQYNSYLTADQVYTLCGGWKDLQVDLRPLVGDEVKKLTKHGTNQHGGVDNIKSSQGGNSREYLLERLKRDHREIFDAWCNGKKFNGSNSVRQAAIAAGIIKVKPAKDAVNTLKATWAKATKAQRGEFLAWTESADTDESAVMQ